MRALRIDARYRADLKSIDFRNSDLFRNQDPAVEICSHHNNYVSLYSFLANRFSDVQPVLELNGKTLLSCRLGKRSFPSSVRPIAV